MCVSVTFCLKFFVLFFLDRHFFCHFWGFMILSLAHAGQTSWIQTTGSSPDYHISSQETKVVGGFNPSEKYESQLGLFFPIHGKLTNVPNHQRHDCIESESISIYRQLSGLFRAVPLQTGFSSLSGTQSAMRIYGCHCGC